MKRGSIVAITSEGKAVSEFATLQENLCAEPAGKYLRRLHELPQTKLFVTFIKQIRVYYSNEFPSRKHDVIITKRKLVRPSYTVNDTSRKATLRFCDVINDI